VILIKNSGILRREILAIGSKLQKSGYEGLNLQQAIRERAYNDYVNTGLIPPEELEAELSIIRTFSKDTPAPVSIEKARDLGLDRSPIKRCSLPI